MPGSNARSGNALPASRLTPWWTFFTALFFTVSMPALSGCGGDSPGAPVEEPAAESASAPAPIQEDFTVWVVGNYFVYHTETCERVTDPAGEVFSGPRSTLVNQNYEPCKICRPDRKSGGE